MDQSAEQLLDLARTHLERVQTSWDEPTDWADLTIYGFLCLEAAIMAAAKYLGWIVRRTHPAKAEASERLAREHGLPNISNLLWNLNDARKAVSYGDMSLPTLDAEDVAIEIENYVEAVESLISNPSPIN